MYNNGIFSQYQYVEPEMLIAKIVHTFTLIDG